MIRELLARDNCTGVCDGESLSRPCERDDFSKFFPISLLNVKRLASKSVADANWSITHFSLDVKRIRCNTQKIFEVSGAWKR